MAGKKKSGYDGKIAGLYDLEETIGHGHFAVVKLARHVFTGEKVAVKVIDKQKLDEVSRAHLFQEVRCMKLVQHPHVVRLYEVIDTQTKLYLILELGDGDMYDYIMKHDKGLDETLARKYFRQIVEAILYCHRLHVVHRDLKPENVVFFNKLGIVKLTDFGFSNVFAPGKKLETSCGSLAYSAPEILLGDSYDPPAVDVWSLGVILFMLVAGRAPFQEANDSETLTMIMDCKYQVPTHVSRGCHELIGKMLVREPGDRIGLEEIERNLWLVSDARDEDLKINLPLLSREHISEEDHSYVVQKMVEGKICTRDEIFQSLERDAYDHIAATYYLLIERRLRKLQHDAAMVQTNLAKQPSASSMLANNKPRLEPLMLSPRKKIEVKKIKTTSMYKSVQSPGYTTISSKLMDTDTPGLGLSVSPIGPEIMKSLTTSMTLDRRSSQRKQKLYFVPCPENDGSKSAGNSSSPTWDRHRQAHSKVKSAPLRPSSPDNVKPGDNKKKFEPSFSKIAILSSFFESKAVQQAGLIPHTSPAQQTLPEGRNRKSKRVALGPHSPTSLGFSEFEHTPQRAQSTSSEHLDSSSLVQSLLSPPGTHPSPGSSSPMMTYMSDEAVVAAVRKCSLILEEVQDMTDDDDGDDDNFQMDAVELKPSRSLEFLDERTLDLSASASQELGLSPASGSGSLEVAKHPYPLKTVCSSPQLLNQIEESELEYECLPSGLVVPQGHYSHGKMVVPQGHYSHGKMAVPEMLGKYDRLRQLRDASSVEDTGRHFKNDDIKAIFTFNCDSSGHSNDRDGLRPEFEAGGLNCTQQRGGALGSSHAESECGVGGGVRSDTGGKKNSDDTKCDSLHNQCDKSTCDVTQMAGGNVVSSVTSSACVGAECENSSGQLTSRGNNAGGSSRSNNAGGSSRSYIAESSSKGELLAQPDVVSRACNQRSSLVPEATSDSRVRTLPALSSGDESASRNKDSSTTPATPDLQTRTLSTGSVRDNSGYRKRLPLRTEAIQDLPTRTVSALSPEDKSGTRVRDLPTTQDLQTRTVSALSPEDKSGTRVRDLPTTQDLPTRTVSALSPEDKSGTRVRDLPTTQDLQTRTVSAASARDESGSRSTDSPTALSNNNNNVISLSGSLATAGVSPAPCTAHYNGQYSSHRRDLAPGSHSVEFSEISDYCDCMDDQAKVSACLGDCGLPSSPHQSPRQGHVKQNGVTSKFCKVGTGSPVVQIESKCCSVV